MSREICGSCDGLIDNDGACDCDPAQVADVALLRQALEALDSICSVKDIAVVVVPSGAVSVLAARQALRERLGVKT